MTEVVSAPPSLAVLLREWGRIGCIGFGGPPAHIALLRDLCVTRRRWIGERDFEDAIAATNLLPGPASTQMAIYCAWRLRGVRGALSTSVTRPQAGRARSGCPPGPRAGSGGRPAR